MKLLRAAYHAMSGFTGGSLDLRTIPPGLIALTGPNYSGKSTLLELPIAAFYREWASRATSDISKWADSRESFVECDVELGDGVYRARVNIDGPARKSQAVLSRQRTDGTWQLMTDGKVSTFDDAMAQLVPPKDALLCSQFAAQNRAGSLTGASRAKRKDLFIHFLWLDHVIAMSDTAKACAAIAETTAMVLRSRIEGFERESSPELEAMLVDQLHESAQQVVTWQERSQTLAGQIAADDAERQALTEVVSEFTTATAERTRLAGVLEAATRGLAALPEMRERVTNQARADESDSRTRVERVVATIDAKIADLTALLASADRVRDAASDVELLHTEIETVRTTLATLPAAKSALEGQIRDQRAAETIESVPCGGQGAFAACRFLAEALAAKTRLDGRTGVELAGVLQTLVDSGKQLQGRLTAAQGRLQGLKPTAAQWPAVQVAADRLEEQQIQREDVVGTEEDRVGELRRRLTVALQDYDVSDAAYCLEMENTRVAVAALQPTLDRTEGARSRVTVLESGLAEARSEWTECARQLATVEMQQADRAGALDALRAKQLKLTALRPRLTEAEDALRVQTLLEKAFHRDGLPTLEIAAAAPVISQLTTDLLEHSGFGSRFRVDVTTLVPTSDGKEWKEDFAIRVWDNDRAKEILDIGDLSGGERILVEEALRAALTIYMSSRHTHRVRTCWRDESSGPLDADNRAKYISMLRRLRDIGGYDHVLFISHSTDCVELADTIVDVCEGRATVRK